MDVGRDSRISADSNQEYPSTKVDIRLLPSFDPKTNGV